MCPLLAQLEIGFFSSFSAAAVYSTNEANKAGLKQSIIFRCLWSKMMYSLGLFFCLRLIFPNSSIEIILQTSIETGMTLLPNGFTRLSLHL